MKLLKLVILTASAVGLASAAEYRLTIFEKSTVAGTELAPGDYKVQVDGDKAKISAGKRSVEATVKVETGNEKYAKTSIRYNNGDGKYLVEEIRLGGTNTKLVFADSQNSAGGNRGVSAR